MRLKRQKTLPRAAGILLPVASLPSPYGIGTFGIDAYRFVDFLEDSGQRYWQVLPLCPTSYGDSPYQSFSAFAGNPYYIDLDTLVEEKLLTKKEVNAPDWGSDPACIDYGAIFRSRFAVLEKAYARSAHKGSEAFSLFCDEHSYWLEGYACYMAIKASLGWVSWSQWPDDIRRRQSRALKSYCRKLENEIGFWKFCQFKFFQQWNNLKKYANGKGIEIIGDIPIYAAMDSADLWTRGGLFQLGEDLLPTHVAGVPPDLFSETGQLWGNPLYDWQAIEADDFLWWRERMRCCALLYDIIRIDHFIGIVHYYSIPAEDTTALNGRWIDGPRENLLKAISEAVGSKKIIAEDLGVVTSHVRQLIKKSGYPGMKILQFAFDSGPGNEYLPCHFDKNCVVYGGTHDNETLAGYFSHQDLKTLKFARAYLNVRTNREIPGAIVRAGYASSANTVLFQLQDLLELDNSARINTPSTLGENWRWRIQRGQIPIRLSGSIKKITTLFGR